MAGTFGRGEPLGNTRVKHNSAGAGWKAEWASAYVLLVRRGPPAKAARVARLGR